MPISCIFLVCASDFSIVLGVFQVLVFAFSEHTSERLSKYFFVNQFISFATFCFTSVVSNVKPLSFNPIPLFISVIFSILILNSTSIRLSLIRLLCVTNYALLSRFLYYSFRYRERATRHGERERKRGKERGDSISQMKQHGAYKWPQWKRLETPQPPRA